MKKLPISVGILAWNSGDTLRATLETYKNNGLFKLVKDVNILFQEFSDEDLKLAVEFNLNFIGHSTNIGIGKGFLNLAEEAESKYLLLLEHDWHLIEDLWTTRRDLYQGLDLLDSGLECIRYRHRTDPGHPHYSFRNKGNELTYYDNEIEAYSPHLLDSIHWLENPDEDFPDKINKVGDWFYTTSKWGNWTNNPCLYRTEFYKSIVQDFVGDGVELEGKISKWWNRQEYGVAHGNGLFKHVDKKKYGN